MKIKSLKTHIVLNELPNIELYKTYYSKQQSVKTGVIERTVPSYLRLKLNSLPKLVLKCCYQLFLYFMFILFQNSDTYIVYGTIQIINISDFAATLQMRNKMSN